MSEDSKQSEAQSLPAQLDQDSEPKEKQPPHPVGAAIEKFVHRIRDAKVAGRVFVAAAFQAQIKRYEQNKEEVEASLKGFESDDPQVRSAALVRLLRAKRTFDRLHKSKPGEVIARSLFLGLFSAFDAFTGELLHALFSRKPELYGSLDRTLSLKEIMTARDIDAVKSAVLADQIEAFRRKSYSEQFSELERRFDLPLMSFPSWRHFIEASQRRNLITHCDGVVSQQYIDQCAAVGYASTDLPGLGQAVDVRSQYFLATCELLIEVGTKLGHTLWRKTLPAELDKADANLNELLYDALYVENWARAIVLGQFAYDQKRFSSEHARRQFAINFAQSLKWGGMDSDSNRILDSFDWSASSLEFRMAAAVLRNQYDAAAGLMRQIGKGSDLIHETAYHTWPLFREFNATAQFAAAYAEIFGYPFFRKVAESVSAAAEQVNKLQAKSAEDEVGRSLEGRGEVEAGRAYDEERSDQPNS